MFIYCYPNGSVVMPCDNKPHDKVRVQRRPLLKSVAGGTAMMMMAGCFGDDDEDPGDLDDTDDGEPADDDSDADDQADDDTDPGDIQMGGTLHAAIESDISSFDSIEIDDGVTRSATGLVYERLTAIDFDLEPQPVLATDWEFIDDTTVRVDLREGVSFHNGDPFDAHSVQSSIERSIGTARDGFVSPWYSDSSIIDDHEIEFELNDPFSPLAAEMWPEIQMVPEGAATGEVNLSEAPIGTGPYQFDDYQPDEFLRLTRYEDHWFEGNDVVPDTPPIEVVEFRPITEASTQEGAVETGELDLATQIDTGSIDRLEEADGVNVHTTIGGTWLDVQFPIHVEPFGNRNIREGTTRLLPREDISQVVFDGVGGIAHLCVPPLFEWAKTPEFRDEMIDEYVGTDPELGVELIEEGLEEVGMEPPIETTILTGDLPYMPQNAEIVRETLENTGLYDIDLDVRVYIPDVIDRVNEQDEDGNALQYDRNELIMTRITGSPSPFEYFNRNLAGPNLIEEGGNSYTGWEDDELNELLSEVQATFEQEEQVEIYQDMMEIVARESPRGYFAWVPEANATTERVRGHEIFYDPAWQFTSIYAPYANSVVWLEDGE